MQKGVFDDLGNRLHRSPGHILSLSKNAVETLPIGIGVAVAELLLAFPRCCGAHRNRPKGP